MPDLETGDKVIWNSMQGTITGFRGEKILVRFEFMKNDFPVPASDLELVEKAEKPQAEETMERTAPVLEERPPIDAGRSEMLVSLEALRFGIAPWGHIRDLTIGFDNLENWTKKYLPDEFSGLKFSRIQGDFGEGKSHTLQVIRRIAKDMGYLTSWLEVDGSTVTLSRPHTVLQQIWANLEGDNLVSTTRLLDLHLKAIEKYGINTMIRKLSKFKRLRQSMETIEICKRAHKLDDFGHRIDCVLSCYSEETASDVRKDILHSVYSTSYINLPPMIGRKLDDRPGDFVESLVGNAYLSSLVGYRGLVITVDEFEVEDYYSHTRSASDKWQRTVNLLQLFEKYALGRTNLPPAPISMFIAAVDEDDDAASISRLVSSTAGGKLNLQQLKQDDLRDLAKKIFSLYMRAYGLDCKFKPEIISAVENSFDSHHENAAGYTRAYIKQLIYELDYMFGPRRDSYRG